MKKRGYKIIISVMIIASMLAWPSAMNADGSGNGHSSSYSAYAATPTADSVITSLPFKDKRTINKSTHVVPEIKNNHGTIRGYVYQIQMEAGKSYAIENFLNSSSSNLYLDVYLVNASGNIIWDGSSIDKNIEYDKDYNHTYSYSATKSGVYYLYVSMTYYGDYKTQTQFATYTLNVYVPGSISGKVTYWGDEGFNRVAVELIRADSTDINNWFRTDSTDTNGRYNLKCIPPGKYVLRYYYLREYDDDGHPYYFKYYGNKYTFKTANIIDVGHSEVKQLPNVELNSRKMAKPIKTINKLPYKYSAVLAQNDTEICIPQNDYDYACDIFHAKTLKVRMKKGKIYKISLNKKNLRKAVLLIYDSSWNLCNWYDYNENDDEYNDYMKYGNYIMTTIVPDRTGYHYIVIADKFNTIKSTNKKFSLSISSAKKPGKISGKVTSSINGKTPNEYYRMWPYMLVGRKWIPVSCITYNEIKDKKGYYHYKVGGLYPGKYRIRFAYDGEVIDDEGIVDVKTIYRYYKKGKPKGVKKISKATTIKLPAGKTKKNIDIKLPIV
jgi:hypothetical protein